MRRVWTNHGLRLLAVSAVLACLSLVALCLVLLIRTNQTQEFREQSAENCRQINVLKTALRETLADGERASLNSVGGDIERRRIIMEYYQRQRNRFADDTCA